MQNHGTSLQNHWLREHHEKNSIISLLVLPISSLAIQVEQNPVKSGALRHY